MLATFTWAATALAITATLAYAASRAWRGWLDLKRYQIAADRSDPAPSGGEPGMRIEMADIRERLRKLEAIAQGVEL
ncbi:hypothetical protein [Allosphingosinicella indica]|uniref:Uncharacterized protein n=1 Tax=Allosphingosinicella indica TaxID=941907 RepID=A0A1X7GAC7_9SPHN|nr:hypothetical protein [Allosphingosinicella indica]SMF65994.1 hypothetical protein SAMN06295910_1353 [Allosphingosinicella indica]